MTNADITQCIFHVMFYYSGLSHVDTSNKETECVHLETFASTVMVSFHCSVILSTMIHSCQPISVIFCSVVSIT